MFGAICRYGNVRIYEPSRRDILNSRSTVGCYPHHSQRGSRRLSRHDVHGHESSEETDQHSDGYSEQDHREDIHPHGISSVQEQRQGQGVQYAEQQGGNLSVSLEEFVREPSREHGSEYSQQGVYRDHGYCFHIRVSLGLLEEQHSPSVYGISGYVHERARCRQHPYRRGAEHLLLNLPNGFVRSRRWLFVGQGFYGRQSFGFGGVVEPAQDDDNAYCTCECRSEEPGLPSCECHDGAHE